jgi:hypothetical protein
VTRENGWSALSGESAHPDPFKGRPLLFFSLRDLPGGRGFACRGLIGSPAHKTGDIKSRVSSWVPSSTPISDSHKPSGQNACKVDYPVFPALEISESRRWVLSKPGALARWRATEGLPQRFFLQVSFYLGFGLTFPAAIGRGDH